MKARRYCSAVGATDPSIRAFSVVGPSYVIEYDLAGTTTDLTCLRKPMSASAESTVANASVGNDECPDDKFTIASKNLHSSSIVTE